MSKQKTPIQQLIDRMNSGLESWNRIKDENNRRKNTNLYKKASEQASALFTIIQLTEQFRDEVEKPLLIGMKADSICASDEESTRLAENWYNETFEL